MTGRTGSRFLVDFKSEDIGPGVVSGRVQVEFPLGDFAGVEVGGENRLAGVVGAGQNAAEWADDDAAAANHDGTGIVALDCRILAGVIAAPEVLAGREYEAATFERDVPHGRSPALAVVHCG